MTFFKGLGIEFASSFSVSRVTFFHAKCSPLSSFLIVLGAGSLYVFSSVVLQMFSMGLRSGEFTGLPSLAIKVGKFFDTMSELLLKCEPVLHPERMSSLSLY